MSLPEGCLKVNGAGIGFQVEGTGSAEALKSDQGKPPCVYGRFVEIDKFVVGGKIDKTIADGASEAKSVGAIYMVSLKTTVIPSNVDEIVTNLKSLAKDAGQLWVRLGHEMNLYATNGVYAINQQTYKQLFQLIATKTRGSNIKMYWCPNPPGGSGDWASLDDWYPEDQYVDINGLDTYMVNDQSQFSDGLVEQFCDKYGKKPLWVGETGILNSKPSGSLASQKANWAKSVLCAKIAASCKKNYLGFSWFEINKVQGAPYVGDDWGDYRVSSNGILKQAIDNAATCAAN